MKQTDFLVELWVEDMPVAVQLEAEQKLKEAVENLLVSEKIDYGQAKTFSTPRRAAVYFQDVERVTREEKISIKGPPSKICFEGDDKPTVVLEGFLKKHSGDAADVRVRDEGKGEFVFLEKIIPAMPAEEVIRKNIVSALEGIKFAKSMRWDNYSFPRPVRNVLVMFGKKALKVCCFGVNSVRSSRGFMGESIKITSPADYETNLKRKRILACASARLEFFREKELKPALSPAEHILDSDEDLIKETAGICEYPKAVCGKFDAEFLKIPHEFLHVTLKFHQKCFPVYGKNGAMTNKFIFVIDGTSANAGEIRGNYARCVTARFEDTKFFWENDKKKKLIDYYDDLKNVNYMGKFATLYEKAERITRDASALAKIYCPGEDGQIRKVSKLLLCDIVTKIVGEFPGLHGAAGQYLAREDEVSATVADSLRGAVEMLHPPRRNPPVGVMMLETLNNVSAVCGLAERLNTLKSFFYADMIPTTSKDPYALIKTADEVVRILAETKGIDFKLAEIFAVVFDDVDGAVTEKVRGFLKERFKLYLVKAGIPADIANMTESKFDVPKDALVLSFAVKAAREEKKEEFAYIAEAAKRIRNILRQAKKLGITPGGVREEIFAEREARELFGVVTKLRGEIESLMNKKDHASALMLLVTVKKPLDLFFEKIMVMDKDESLRDNRLGLLVMIDKLFTTFGKFDTLNALASVNNAEKNDGVG